MPLFPGTDNPSVPYGPYLDRGMSSSLPVTIANNATHDFDLPYDDDNDFGDTSDWWDGTTLTRAGLYEVYFRASLSGPGPWKVRHYMGWNNGRRWFEGNTNTIEDTTTVGSHPSLTTNPFEFLVENHSGSSFNVTTLQVQIAPVLFIDPI